MTRRWPRPCAIRACGCFPARRNGHGRGTDAAGAGPYRLRQPRHFRGADPVLASVLAQDFPREQVGLLRALFNGSLPFAAEDIAVVKRDITLSSGKGLRFMGKTGSGSDDADRGIIGWFVGGVETPHNRWSFAVNIQGPDASGVRARGSSPKRRSNGSASCPSVPAPPKGGSRPPLKSYNSFRQFTRSPFPCHTREW